MPTLPQARGAKHLDAMPTVALLPFGYTIEYFLDMIDLSLESFCVEMSGGWLFGYIEALKRAGIRTILICFSTAVDKPRRYITRSTGLPAWALPAPRLYRALKRRIPRPYGHYVSHAFPGVTGVRRLSYPLLWALKELAPYCAIDSKQLAPLLRQEHCGAILCQEYEWPGFDSCVRLGRSLHLPVFGVFQGGDYQRGRLERVIRPRTIRAAAGLIIATQKETQRVRERYDIEEAKLTNIFNPLDLEEWTPGDRNVSRESLGIPLTARVVAWHGRVSIQPKGLDILLSAWQQLCERRKDRELQLVLVGSGQDADELRQRIESMHLMGVHWLNEYVLDRVVIRRHLCAADVYAFPSRHEGFPVALVEAMACGLPVVAADANGVADILEGGETSGGIVVPREDAEALAGSLGSLLDDEAESRTWGRRARRRVESKFSLEEVGEQLRTFLCGHGFGKSNL